jgi:hypothetical protein
VVPTTNSIDDASKEIRKAFKYLSPSRTGYEPRLLRLNPCHYLSEYTEVTGTSVFRGLLLSLLQIIEYRFTKHTECPHRICASVIYWLILQGIPIPSQVFSDGRFDSMVFSNLVKVKETKLKELSSFFNQYLQEPYSISLRRVYHSIRF